MMTMKHDTVRTKTKGRVVFTEKGDTVLFTCCGGAGEEESLQAKQEMEQSFGGGGSAGRGWMWGPGRALWRSSGAIDSLRFPLTLSSPVGPLSQMSVRSDVVTCLSVGREDALWHLMRRVWPALLPLCPLGLEAAAVGEGEPRGGRRPGPFVRLECCSSGNRLLLTCSLYSYLVCISAL